MSNIDHHDVGDGPAISSRFMMEVRNGLRREKGIGEGSAAHNLRSTPCSDLPQALQGAADESVWKDPRW